MVSAIVKANIAYLSESMPQSTETIMRYSKQYTLLRSDGVHSCSVYCVCYVDKTTAQT